MFTFAPPIFGLIGHNYALHQRVAYHIAITETAKRNALYAIQQTVGLA
jgi:hypothetical protein